MEPNNAQAIIEAVERLAKVTTVDMPEGYGPDSAATPLVAAVSKGVNLESLKPFFDELRPHPERREGTAVLEDVESFCSYVNRFKNVHSAIFATEGDGEPRLRGIIDHHEEGPEGQARFGRHIAAYDFPLSEQWRAWGSVDGDRMTQEAFAEFLEDRLLDVQEPNSAGDSAAKFAADFAVKLATPAQLRDLSKGLSVRVNQHAAQKLNTNTGETTLSFSEDHSQEDGTPMTVPGGFVLGIPVFHAGAGYQLHARLRYRMAGRSVIWTVKLHRPDAVFQHAFNEAADKVAEKTNCPVFRGHPEK